MIVAAMLAACDSSIPEVSLGLDEAYSIERMRKLPLEPALTGEAYRWTVNGETVSDERRYVFMAAEEGDYLLTFDIIDPATPYHHEMTVSVLHEQVEYSPYIAQVYEYCPAPGQFVNEMPAWEPGDTYADMLVKATDCISGTNDVMITLGAYGGYVTFGFDHTVVNVPGSYDFRIWGNCFYELLNPGRKGGSCEPGIVMVSYDTNCNGIPDDPWYELAGSEYRTARHGYAITYHRPDPERQVISSGQLCDVEYIRWDDSEGQSGHVSQNIFHTQDYYPRWVSADRLTFSGSLLPPNAVDESGNGTYYVLYSYPWGYVDNHPNEFEELNSFDISWAVDPQGKPVSLPGADFIRVYTGVNQYCGWLGETSTELSRAMDLHIDLNLPVLPNP